VKITYKRNTTTHSLRHTISDSDHL